MHNKVPKNEYLNKKGYAPKKNPEKIVNEGVIYDPRGQWAFPGEVTKIPSGDITMQGVSYPVLGVDDLGNEQMMYPGFDYTFPGNTVTEYPQLQYGGDPSIPELDQAKKGGWLNKYSKMPKKKSSKNIKTSINKLMTRNPLFDRNYMLYGAKGPRLYDPNSKYQSGGITINSEEEYRKSLLMKNKTKERIDAERKWAAKKVAAKKTTQNTKPAVKPAPVTNPGGLIALAPSMVSTPVQKPSSATPAYLKPVQRDKTYVTPSYRIPPTDKVVESNYYLGPSWWEYRNPAYDSDFENRLEYLPGAGSVAGVNDWMYSAHNLAKHPLDLRSNLAFGLETASMIPLGRIISNPIKRVAIEAAPQFLADQVEDYKKGGSPRKSPEKLVNYSQNHNFVKTQSNSWLDKYK
jgi:hypothetical protein